MKYSLSPSSSHPPSVTNPQRHKPSSGWLKLGAVFLLCAPLSLAACDSDPSLDGKDGNGQGEGGEGNGSGSGSGNGRGPGGLNPGVIPPTDSGGGNGEPEICDGIDNDGDGIIDNVDADGDGVCDCLNIGTIGRIGPWSEGGGNIFKEWLDTRSPIPAKEIDNNELTEEELRGLDVIVVLKADTAPLTIGSYSAPAHHEFSAAEVSAMKNWVEAGGGLLTTIGYQGNETEEIKNVNRLLGAFDLGYASPSRDVTGFLTDWDAQHPVSKGIEKIYTDNGSQPATDKESITVIARTGNNRPALIADTPEKGRILVFGDEWITYDSEWEDTEDQQVELLWLNMLKWLSPPDRCQVPIPPTILR